MPTVAEQNLTLLTDFYELTMGNGYFLNGFYKKQTYFDVFYRSVPDNGGFAIACGLTDIIEYVKNLHFSEADIEFLRSKGIFDERFLKYLRKFKFTGDIYAVPEGTPVFPHEPIITVKAPAAEAQLMETFILLCINHQSCIATKANRIVRASEGRPVMEFGSRRAQGVSGAVIGARAAYIGGCVATACTLTDELYSVPAAGTMAHSWVQMFDTEYEAFKFYAETYPNNAVLLVDTYNTLKSGVPNAIRVFKEYLASGKTFGNFGIRLDSGDLAYLTKKARFMLDEAGLADAKIVVSNSLDEYLIRDLLQQGAKIDSFGVGERLITSASNPVFGAVYKLAAIKKGGKFIPKIKVSETAEKITDPGLKKIYRVYNKEGKAIADYLACYDEKIDSSKPVRYIDPQKYWKERSFENCTFKNLQVKVIEDGKQIYQCPSVEEIRSYVQRQLKEEIWVEEQRFENPHGHYYDMSPAMYELKMNLLYTLGKAK